MPLVNLGLSSITFFLSQQTGTWFGAWGTGAGTTALDDTTLFTESKSAEVDGSGYHRRVECVSTQETRDKFNDIWRAVVTLVADASKTITNVGIFDSDGVAANTTDPPAGGNLITKVDCAPSIDVPSGKSLVITFNHIFKNEGTVG
ncbi:MAG: hypothetical protein EKK48_12210 [Candidatus Melainabacteria bacterium]|nr:MAG: hypothetical protein EKK48_12210 [Candidatus Melainabacteria bacterium]